MANTAAHAHSDSRSTSCAATFEAMPASVVAGAVAGLGFGGHAGMAVVVDSVVAVVAPVAEGVENVKALVAAATSVEVERFVLFLQPRCDSEAFANRRSFCRRGAVPAVPLIALPVSCKW